MPKLATPLTDTAVKNAKPREKTYTLGDGGGMYLEITKTGAKFWRMGYVQSNGKTNRLTFGRYPEVTLAEARDRRLKARRLLDQGIDPSHGKKERQREQDEADANTFEKLARDWHTNRLSSWSAATARDTIRRLEIDIFPEIANLEKRRSERHCCPKGSRGLTGKRNKGSRGHHELCPSRRRI